MISRQTTVHIFIVLLQRAAIFKQRVIEISRWFVAVETMRISRNALSVSRCWRNTNERERERFKHGLYKDYVTRVPWTKMHSVAATIIIIYYMIVVEAVTRRIVRLAVSACRKRLKLLTKRLNIIDAQLLSVSLHRSVKFSGKVCKSNLIWSFIIELFCNEKLIGMANFIKSLLLFKTEYTQ